MLYFSPMQASYQPDPLGKAVMDFLETGVDKPVRVWINGKEEPFLYPSVFLRNPESMPPIERTALDLSSGKILDVGAGAGCHSRELLGRGVEVVSLERSPLLCDVMRNLGMQQIICQDILKYQSEGFDTILLLMNGFGIAGTESALPDFLLHLKSLLKPGGQIIGESSDVLYMIQQNPEFREMDLSKGYYGEVQFKLKYLSDEIEFPWLYADEFLLEAIALEVGLSFEIIERGPDYNFLCRLSI